MKRASSSEQSREIKKRIIEILDRGHTQVEAAEATGTTRQYVSYIAASYRKKGHTIFEERRGRKKDRPLTEEHVRSLFKTITRTKPEEVGIEGDSWTETRVKDWFKKKFDRTITRHQVRRFCMTHNVRLTRERRSYDDLLSSEEEEDIRRMSPGANGDPIPPDSLKEDDGSDLEPFLTAKGELDLKAMQASVAKTQAELAAKGHNPLMDVTGLRAGKHSKQRNAPFTSKKKRKK